MSDTSNASDYLQAKIKQVLKRGDQAKAESATAREASEKTCADADTLLQEIAESRKKGQNAKARASKGARAK